MSGPVVVAEPGPVWTITMNRPESRNAVSAELIERLVEAVRGAAADPGCRAVVLAGAGRDFCSGADVSELAGEGRTGAVGYGQVFESLLRAIEEQDRPVVAAVQGSALGAGCQLLLACDLVVAEEDARIGIPSARLGIVIPLDNVERLVVAVGPKRAADLLLSGRVLTGAEAEEWGLVARTTEAGSAGAAALELARRIASLAPLSVGASKRGIRTVLRGLRPDRDDEAHRREFEELAGRALRSEDLMEGLAAFRERRAPRFRGR